MRTIKFRAWDPDFEEMLEVKAIIFDSKTLIPDRERKEAYILDEHNDVHYLSDIKLMQYTGIDDNFYKEIYEGDIVEITDMMPIDRYFGKSYICEVVWSEDGCILKDYKGGGSDKISKTSSIPNFKEINVIGNIYENKELLEE